MSLENTKNNTVESLFKQYYNPLYNFVNSKIRNSEDAKEVVQDVFVKLWNAKGKIDLDSPTIKSYLYTMARNTMIDAIRKKRDQSDVDIDNLDAGSIATDDGDALDPYIIRTEIMKSLSILKPKTRQIFKLNKLQGYTYEEIATHMEISVRTVEDNMSRAYGLLRQELKKNEIFS